MKTTVRNNCKLNDDFDVKKESNLKLCLTNGVLVIAAAFLLLATPVGAVDTLPILWEAGGQSAGNDSAGQAARIATDASGNLAVVSGPSLARDLAVTSYTSTGGFRWKNAVSPSSGTFTGDWVAAAPNGDFVAVGTNVNSSGNPIAITLVRFGSDGIFQWRVDLGGLFPGVGRLLVDAGGNAYLAFNSLGDGQDIRLHKYSPSGALLWSQAINTGLASNNVATSLTFSPDETEVALTGDTVGGSEWITAVYDTSTGVRKWLVVAPEGTAALDVVMDADKVYVTGLGRVNITGFLTVVAYDRATGARLWRTDKKPVDGGNAAGLRIALAPDGSVVATGQTSRGFLDWYTVTFETTGSVRWEAVRDGGLNTDEIPAAVLVLPDGTTVVTGRGGPNLPGGYWPGVTAGYSPAGSLLWEAFSPLPTVWATALPNGDVVATGGYDAYLAAFRPSGTVGCTVDANCDDGTFCNGAEVCNPGTGLCEAGTLPDVDDGVACTVDLCNETTDSIDHLPNNGLCVDDGFFCNGVETCDQVLGCQSGPEPCPDLCDEFNDVCIGCGDGTCDPGEDCISCGADCISGALPGTVCGNGLCEAGDGENGVNCSADCARKLSGKVQNRFSCGFGDGYAPDGCGDSRCTTGGFMCTTVPTPAGDFCCGDLACEGAENSSSCAVDCGPPAPFCGDAICDPGEDPCSCATDCGAPPGSEAGYCTDGIDNDCSGGIDCSDSDCSADPSCINSCEPVGVSCDVNAECCSNKCKGPAGNKTCK